MPLLTVSNLTTAFATSRGEITAVEDFSFSLGDGEIHSATLMQAAVWPGSADVKPLMGGSTLGPLLVRLTSGNVILDGADITRLRLAELRAKRRDADRPSAERR